MCDPQVEVSFTTSKEAFQGSVEMVASSSTSLRRGARWLARGMDHMSVSCVRSVIVTSFRFLSESSRDRDVLLWLSARISMSFIALHSFTGNTCPHAMPPW